MRNCATARPAANGFGTARRPTTCVITKQPAKYVDPLTNLPYANIAAFKAIRAKVSTGEIKLPEWRVAKSGLSLNETQKSK